MISDIKKLQELQFKYLGVVDMQIETRKDQNVTLVTYCNYADGFEYKSKLYVHKLKWYVNNDTVMHEIELDLEMLSKKY